MNNGGGYGGGLHSRPSLGDHRSVTSYTTTSSATTPGSGASILAPPGSSSDSPVQSSGSIANRTAHAQYGLYQQCLTLQRRLKRVPGFAGLYLINDYDNGGTVTAATPLSPTDGPSDPVNTVCGCLRLGASLTYMFNLLGEGKPLDVDPDATPTNSKACKKSAAHFIMACHQRLGWPYEEMFTTTELLSQSTNGVVKVYTHTLCILL